MVIAALLFGIVLLPWKQMRVAVASVVVSVVVMLVVGAVGLAVAED
jgi:hypothetical protein